MSAISTPRLKTFKAAGVIRPYRYVKWSSVDGQMEECDANEKAIGIYQGEDTLAAGDFGEVALPGGGGLLKAGEAIAAGKLVTSDADGQGEVVDAAGEFYGAVAYEGAASGDVFYVEVVAPTEAVSSDA
jgi:hypothetical protein